MKPNKNKGRAYDRAYNGVNNANKKERDSYFVSFIYIHGFNF